VNALKREGDIVIMDELGYLELEAYEFQLQVIKVLESSIPVLGVLRNEKNIFLEKVGAISEVVEVKLENRDALPEILLKKIKCLLEESI
jgi:nucleoside-triphosphatase THEP1